MIKKLDLTAGFWGAVLLVLIVSVTDNFVIRLILSLPLMCLTGHTVLRAVKPVHTPGSLEHSVFAAAVGIAVCVAGGFVLNTVAMLNPIGWAIWFLVTNGIAALIAYCQPYEPVVISTLPKIRIWHIATFCVAIGVMVGSYVLSAYVVDSFHEFTYTQFWLLPEPSPGKMMIGIQNREGDPEEYDIDVSADKTMIATFRSINLAPGQRWVRQITVSLNQKRVEAHLYRARDHALYRKVSALAPGAWLSINSSMTSLR